jgi:uncharacterized protein
MTPAESVLLLTAWLTGLAGSAHCLGMCGGIAGAIGITRGAGARRLTLLALVHCGRAFGYAAIGAIAGFAGATLAGMLLGAHGATGLRTLAGVLTILIGGKLLLGGAWLGGIERGAARFWRHLAPAWRSLLPATDPLRALFAGVLWGWLPCGLVYAELGVAASTGSALTGAAVMLSFGLGTALSMGALSVLLETLGLNRLSQRWSGALLVAFGVWVVLASLQGARMHAA